MAPKPNSALVILGHGSTVNPDSSAPTRAHAAEIARRGLFGEVVCAFWMEEPHWRDVWELVRSDDVYVVPDFISAGYFTKTVIPRELGLAGAITVRGSRTVKYCEPVGRHAHMTDLLLRRAREFAPGVPPGETCLVIIGHGTPRDKNSSAAVKEQVRRIEARGLYAQVLGMFMEEEPFVADWHRGATQPNVVAVPFFIADGLHSYQDIPVLMGIEPTIGPAASRADIFRLNPYRAHDRTLFYAGAIGTEPGFADLILDQVEAFDLQHGEFLPEEKKEAAR
jgi:sirohydrochlorin cobaltochelatase